MRRLYLVCFFCVVCGIPNISHSKPIIFNSDGYAVWKAAKGDTRQWINNLFGPLEGTSVNMLFWNDGAGGNTANYNSEILELTGERAGNIDPALLKAISEGNDPPVVVIQEAKKRNLRVFYSYRVNDIHDAFIPEELPSFKVEHPDWLLGDNNGTIYWTALNFAVPEVVQLKIAIVQEIIDKYDFDGLELDFLRSSPYFSPGTEPQNAHILTKFVRSIRKMLKDKSIETKKKIELAVRVTETLEGCYLDGFDIETWVKEGLIDYLILGSGHIADVREFKNIVKGMPVKIIPCVYAYAFNGIREPDGVPHSPIEIYRGQVATHFRQGADGEYFFNFFPHTKTGSCLNLACYQENWDPNDPGLQQKFLYEPSSLKSLAEKDMIFAARAGWPLGELPARDYPHNGLINDLPLHIESGVGKINSFKIYLPYNLKQYRKYIASVVLAARVSSLNDTEAVSFFINGKYIGQRIEDELFPYFWGAFGPTMPEEEEIPEWLSIPIKVKDLKIGDNTISVIPTEQVDLLNLELHIIYKK